MKIQLLIPAAVLLLSAAQAQMPAQTCSLPLYPGPATAIDTSSCSLIGNDGAETNQNEAKNNFCPSSGTAAPRAMKISDFVTLQQQVQKNKSIPFGNQDKHPLTTKPGPATNRAPLVSLGEGKQVVLTGFVKIARLEGKESVNCTSSVPDLPLYHDIHISIVATAAAAECTGIVAEMIPRHRPAAWTPDLLNSVATAKLAVRITGQLMFDSSHTPCQSGKAVSGDPARASLWEIHPIYQFEVCPMGTCASGGWIAVENWIP